MECNLAVTCSTWMQISPLSLMSVLTVTDNGTSDQLAATLLTWYAATGELVLLG